MSNLYGILNSGEVPTHKPTQTHEGYSYTHVNTKAEGWDITPSSSDEDGTKLLLVKYVNKLEFLLCKNGTWLSDISDTVVYITRSAWQMFQPTVLYIRFVTLIPN